MLIENRGRTPSSVGLGPDDAFGAGLAAEGARAGLVIAEWNAPHGDAEFVGDLLFDLDIAAEMRPCKARMRRRRIARWRREPLAELVGVVDDSRVGIAKRQRPLEHARLHVVEDVCHGAQEFRPRHTGFVLGIPVTPGHEHVVAVHVTRADFQTNRHTAPDPLPILLTAAKIAIVNLHLKMPTVIRQHAKVIGELAAVVVNLLGVVALAFDGQNDHVRRRQPRRAHQSVVVGVAT